MKSPNCAPIILFMLTYLFGCNKGDTAAENSSPIQSKTSYRHESIEAVTKPEVISKHIKFNIDLGDINLTASVDKMGNVIISNYPVEWLGKVTLDRFDGQIGVEAPFSPTHCDNIRDMASNKPIGALVRSGYHSLITFEVPPFMSYDLMEAITNSAQAAGANFTSFYLNNPIDKIHSKLELSLNDNAISNLIGNIAALKEQLHLGQKGMLKGPFKQQVLVYSADIICDLISGAATISMIYPIKGQNQVIKVIYEPMKVKPY
jgi:hypothetical protein